MKQLQIYNYLPEGRTIGGFNICRWSILAFSDPFSTSIHHHYTLPGKTYPVNRKPGVRHSTKLRASKK